MIVAVPGTALILLRGDLITWSYVALVTVAIPALRSLYIYGQSLGCFSAAKGFAPRL